MVRTWDGIEEHLQAHHMTQGILNVRHLATPLIEFAGRERPVMKMASTQGQFKKTNKGNLQEHVTKIEKNVYGELTAKLYCSRVHGAFVWR